MELILLAIFGLVLLGSLDRWLHPQPRSHAAATRRAPQRRAPQRRRARRPVASHRHSHAQVRPFLSLGPSVRR